MTNDELDYSYNDLQLLLSLQEDPMQTYSKIATNLGKSVKTISRWISRLEENKLFFPVRAVLDYPLLNMNMFTIIIEVDSLLKVKHLEQILDEHPYIVYRSRLNGAFNGLYVKFRSPNNTGSLYQEFIDRLIKENFILNGRLYSFNEREIITKFNLNYWDNNKFEWTFDWEDWERSMNERNIEKVPKIRYPIFNEKLFKKLDKKDIFILRLLNENAKMKLKDIEANLKKENISNDNIQRISERVQFLKSNFIIDYRLDVNSKVVDIYNTLMIDVDCNDKIVSKFKSQILLNPPPFPGNFKVKENGFVWYLSLPASHFSKVSSLLWKENLEKYRVSFVDYSNSMTYSLWEIGYDSDTKDWNRSREFIVTSQIEKLLSKNKKK